MIAELRGRWAALSNFHVEADGTTVEARFQAAKTLDPDEAARVLAAPTPGQAKRLGRRVTLRPDWEQVKLDVMRAELIRKFSDPTLAALLDSTEDGDIQEGNAWNDTYWGVSLRTGRGQNHLGRLLVEVRAANRALSGEQCDSCAENNQTRAAVVVIEVVGSNSGAGSEFPACGSCALETIAALPPGDTDLVIGALR